MLAFSADSLILLSMDELANKIRNFLQYIVIHIIEDKDQATLKLSKSEEERYLNFRIILSDNDVAKLIGKNGFTASAIRSVIKAAGEKEDIGVGLKINSVSEERSAA